MPARTAGVRRVPILALAASATLMFCAGCGNQRRAVSSKTPAPSAASKTIRVPRAGLAVAVPRNLTVGRDVAPPAVFRASLGEPFVAAFAYSRTEQLPRTAAELAAARGRLARAVQQREPGYKLLRSNISEFDGARAVELLGRQTLSRRRFQIRSLHVFKGRAEYVLEVVAPVEQFATFDGRVTPLLRQTLDVNGTVRAGG